MNGEMFQVCAIVAAAKIALKENKPIELSLPQYESSAKFIFAPQKKLFHTETFTAPDINSWFSHIKEKGLQDIKLLCPNEVSDRNILGFSNTTQCLIVCFFKRGRATFFTSNWSFNKEQKHWDVVYTEQIWKNPPKEKPRFENNTVAFLKALTDIGNLASKIDFSYFADVFRNASEILKGEGKEPKIYEMPPLPKTHINLFKAAYVADVFGTMGSWNDSPLFSAHEKGLSKEYETISAELLKNIRLAILYSVNEW